MTALRSTLVTTAALVLLAGCGEAGRANDPAGSDTGLTDLQGRSFRSVSLVDGADKPLQPGTRVILSFTEDSVSGSAGCNSIGSSATVTDGRLVVRGGVGGTEMGCGKLQYHDAWIGDLLTSRPRLELAGDRLTLTSGGTVVELQDSESAEPDQPLAGPLWTLETLEDGSGPDGTASSVPAGVSSTLMFGEDGAVDASLGCNSGSADYVVDGARLSSRPMVQTQMDCGGPAMQIESTVSGMLRGPVTWTVEGSRLRLTKGERTLVYRAD
jgi:heat shock protein HslJ